MTRRKAKLLDVGDQVWRLGAWHVIEDLADHGDTIVVYFTNDERVTFRPTDDVVCAG